MRWIISRASCSSIISPSSSVSCFAGRPNSAVRALDAFAEAKRICAVSPHPARPAGRGQPMHASPVKALATQRGLRVYQPESFKSQEALEALRGLELDVLVVVAYGLILPPEIGRASC